MTFRKWLVTFKVDFVTREFIPLKILFFFMAGGMTTLFPFLTIQARSLGITGEELGLIYSLLPIIGILVPSMAGIMADKIGNFKIFLSISVICSGLASLLFLVIPPARIEHSLPEQLPFIVNCTMSENVVHVDHPFNCDIKNNTKNAFLSVEECRYRCSTNFQQKHLIHEFIEKWCDTTQNCQIGNEIEFESSNEYHIQNSTSNYKVTIPKPTNHVLFINNLSLPVKLNPAKLKDKFSLHLLFCPNFKEFTESNKQFYPTLLQEETTKEECWLECKGSSETKSICRNKKFTETLDPVFTVMLYIVVRLINGLTLATSFTLFEGAVVAIVKEHGGDLGFQRLYGNLGMIALTPISGKLIDVFSKRSGKEDYSPAFFLYCGIKLLCAFCLLFINLDFKPPSNRVIKDFKELIVQPRVVAFLLFTLVSGTCFGFIETFLFWLLEDLGASKGLMGMTITVGAAFGIPLLMMSSFFIKKIGHVNTLCICIIIFVVRFIGYSLILNPWLAMPFEALESFTNSLMSVASISYAGELSKPSTVASLQGIYGGTYHGVGKGVGSLAGGILIKHIGNSGTFQVFAVAAGLTGFIYFVINKAILNRKDLTAVEKSTNILNTDDEDVDDNLNKQGNNIGNEKDKKNTQIVPI